LTFRRYNQEEEDQFVIGISNQTTSYIIYENCTAYEIGGNGFQTHNSDFISYINCDAYMCADTLRSGYPGNGGAGFSFTGEPLIDGTISFSGCRAWDASDDGFHGDYEGLVTIENCWSWSNGYLEGGGSGFKPAYIYADIEPLARIITNCISANNLWNGFHENTYEVGKININVFNCTSYGNSYGYNIPYSATWPDNINTYKNNVAYANSTSAVSAPGTYYHSYNTWDIPITLTNADFLSVDYTEMERPRKSDGSLPEIDFMKPSATSQLIDSGTDVGLDYDGGAPDLGAFEYAETIPQYGKYIFSNGKPVFSNGKIVIQ
jgi:hypothetical protein